MLLKFEKCRGGRVNLDPLDIIRVDEDEMRVGDAVRKVASIKTGDGEKVMVFDDERSVAAVIDEAQRYLTEEPMPEGADVANGAATVGADEDPRADARAEGASGPTGAPEEAGYANPHPA